MEMPDINETGLNKFDSEQMDKIKLQLQTLDDTIQGGLRSANLKEYRNTYVINAQDSLDASYPMYVHFNIIPEMTKIVSIQLSFWFLNFRAYSTGAASGGGQTSSSVTTPSGGGSTSGATGSASGGGSTSGSGGGQTSSDASAYILGYVCQVRGSVNNVGDENRDGWLVTEFQPELGGEPYQLSIKSHVHTITNHTHSTPAHTHPNHTHSTPAHTHPAHSHTVANHTHNITYGIFEEETSPTVMVFISKDSGLTYSLPIGSYTKDQEILDITRFIDTKGSKMIKFTSNTRTRLSVQITVKLDISAR